MVWLSNIFRMGSNYFPGMISDSRARVLSNCWFLRKSINIISFFFCVCGGGGGIDYWPFSSLWICACFVGKALITIVGCLETLFWVYKLALITSNNNHQHRKMAQSLITKNITGKGKGIFYQLNIWLWCSKEPSQWDGSLHHMFWSIKRKFIFYHTHFHSCRLSRCLRKDRLYIEWQSYYDKTKKVIVSNNEADHLRVIASVNLTHHIQTYITPSEVQILI